MSSRRLQDMSSRRLQDMSSKRLQDMSSKRLQDVFSVTIARCLQDFFARCLRDVLEDVIVTLKTCWRRLQDQQMFPGMRPAVNVPQPSSLTPPTIPNDFGSATVE